MSTSPGIVSVVLATILPGNQFGVWVATEEIRYVVQCRDCGHRKTASEATLRGPRGRARCPHCGAGARTARRDPGVTSSVLYRRWVQIRHRCSPSSSGQDRRRYYDRGIRVCPEWQDFETFRAWAEATGWQPDGSLTIERINNDGPYAPDNCRWATAAEQALNRSNTPLVEAFGERKSVTAWASDPRCIVPFGPLYDRLFRSPRSWEPERAMTTPVRPKAPKGQAKRQR